MGFPVIRIHGDEGQHIDGRLEGIKFSISADVMKAVSWITALHILSEGLSKTVGTSFVSVARGALFICPHKDTVVIFAILKESLFFRKIGNHITVNVAVFHQVSKDAPHIGIGLGQFKWFLKRFLPSSSRRVYCTLLTSQERFDCVRVWFFNLEERLEDDFEVFSFRTGESAGNIMSRKQLCVVPL